MITTENKPENPPERPPGHPIENGEGPVHVGPHVSASSSVITNLESCKPEYPRASLLREEAGTVRVRFEIGADSKLIAASVLHSSGYPMLDKAAVNALSRCQFKAALQDGTPVSSSLVTDYVWKLDGE